MKRSAESSHEKCTGAEAGAWTKAPWPAPPGDLALDIESIVSAGEYARFSEAMTFYMVGCSGTDPATTTTAVATEIVRRDETDGSAFLYHLGDVSYLDKKDTDPTTEMHNQFLAPYAGYAKPIVAIAGNHDGKNPSPPAPAPTSVEVFRERFCADPATWPGNQSGTPPSKPWAMIQPYLYWRFDTPLACFIGLYANIANGGMLDDPAKHPDYTKGKQYRWLVAQLEGVRQQNAAAAPGAQRAVLVTVHYPPYSGATNFEVRGDQRCAATKGRSQAPHLAAALQQAFADSGQRADAVFSAHAHLFQRLTYTYADKTAMPCVIAGNGGHSLENLFEASDGTKGKKKTVPFTAVMPGALALPAGDSACVEAYADKKRSVFGGNEAKGGEYGFIRVTIESRVLTCAYFDTSGAQGDTFSLDLDTHRYVGAGPGGD